MADLDDQVEVMSILDAMIAEITYLMTRYGDVGIEVYVTHELRYQFVQLVGEPSIWQYKPNEIHTETVWGLPLHTILTNRIDKPYRVVITGDVDR